MYTLYIANKNYSSWSLRPWVLLKELRIPFKENLNQINGYHNYESFRRFSQNGKVPCLLDNGQYIWDSLAICEYLNENHAGVWPINPEVRAWSRCVVSEMHSGFSALRNTLGMSVGVRVSLHSMSEGLMRDIYRINEIIDYGLNHNGGPFLAGDKFTATDAFFTPVAFRYRTYGIEAPTKVNEYFSMLLSLPSVLEWEKSALSETWRDPDHENEVLAVGTITHDYRAT